MPLWIAWVFAGALAAVDAGWIALAGERVEHIAWWHPGVFALLAVALVCRNRFPRIAASCEGISQGLIFLPILSLYIYLCATPALPLADADLAAVDHALSFDWPIWYRLATASPTIHESLVVLYKMTWTIQLGALPLLLPIINPRRNAEVLMVNATAMFLIGIGSMLVPAAGAPFYFGLQPDQALVPGHEMFLALRATPRVIDLGNLQGVVVFPSYHAAAAIIFAYAARGVGRLSRISVCLNGLTLLSVPVIGGHYLTDVVAGVAIAALSIAAVRALARVAPSPVEARLRPATSEASFPASYD